MADSFVVEKEMALTHADFFRTLPSALGGKPFRRTARSVTVRDGEKRLTITLGPERIRQIAMMEIPACDVHLEFSGYPPPERKAALDLFDRMFRKGGG